MKKALVIVDVQNDFVDGSLGSKDAQAIIPHVIQEIQKQDAQIYVTLDTHHANYLDTFEGQHLPVEHCIRGTHGWLLNKEIQDVLPNTFITVEKPTFASFSLLQYITSEKCE